jgi:hypothetical protein
VVTGLGCVVATGVRVLVVRLSAPLVVEASVAVVHPVKAISIRIELPRILPKIPPVWLQASSNR